MSSITNGLRQLRCQRPSLPAQLAAPRHLPLAMRTITTSTPTTTDAATQDVPSGSMAALKAALAAHPSPFNKEIAVRTVPATPSYFTRQPVFNDLFIQLNTLLTKYHHLPTSAAAELNPVPWLKLQDLRERMAEPIKSSQFSKVMRIAKRLQMIDESLRPAEVNLVLGSFQRTIDSRLNKAKAAYIDKFGRAVGTGRRKASKARAFVVEGTGEMLVNGKPLSEAFGRVHDRESALWALKATGRLDKYNVWALVEGGGTTGQAEAITLAVAKGLLAHEPALKPALRSAGCVTRDPRAVERKKHGHVKARKSPTWVKR